MKSELSFEISDSLSTKTMRLFDTSHYCEEIENELIEVLPVNSSRWVTFQVPKSFSLILNSSNLRYNKVTTTDQLLDLPDGIYEFKQSIKPNILTVVNSYHLRVVNFKRSLQEEYNNLIDDTCKLSKEEFYSQREKLRNIDEYVLAAKWQVEECLDKERGKELYEFALKLLNEYKNDCKC